jgi:hypothetical protein
VQVASRTAVKQYVNGRYDLVMNAGPKAHHWLPSKKSASKKPPNRLK